MYDTTSGTTWSYSYDNENHMIEAQETVSGTLSMVVNYEYDAFGSQVEESVATLSGGSWVTTLTAYALDHWIPATAGATGLSGTNVVADMTASGSLATGYVWGNQVDQLFGRYDTGLSTPPTAGAYYDFTDRQGSIRDIVNSNDIS